MTTADTLRELAERIQRAEAQFEETAERSSPDTLDQFVWGRVQRAKASGLRLARVYVQDALRDLEDAP